MKGQPPLLDLESKFQDYLLYSKQDIFNHVVGTSNVPAEIRLSIYGHAYRSRLHEALSDTFSALHTYMGDDAFEELCLAYIDANPSSFRSIRWFGDQLATFIGNNSPYHATPYLSELATLEWTMSSVFDAADSSVLQIQDIQTISPEAWIDMRLQLHPSAHRLCFSWNTVQIWQAITEEQMPPDPEQDAPIDWIFWRQELICQYSSLSEDEAWAIDNVIKGATFGKLCEGLCQWVDEQDAGMHAASLLKGWITAGLIAKVTY